MQYISRRKAYFFSTILSTKMSFSTNFSTGIFHTSRDNLNQIKTFNVVISRHSEKN
jgi:hypothetical protein